MAYLKKNPRVAIVLLILFALALGIATWMLTSGLRQHGRGALGLRVYHYDANAGVLVGVPTTIAAGSELAQLNSLLTRFCNAPSNLVGLWPPGTELVELDFDEETGTVGIALSASHREVPVFYEGLFRAALTLTFTQMRFVEEVIFWVVGEGEKYDVLFATWLRDEAYRDNAAIRIETAETVDNNPSISPGVMQERNVTLYFLNTDGNALIVETFTDEYVDIHRWVEFTLNMLIAGPNDDYAMRIIPTETQVRRVERDRDWAARSVYVDLSGDFITRFVGTSQQAGLMLQSIVNTLTYSANNPETTGGNQIVQVFFLVNSQRYQTFHGVLDFDLAFTYNHEIRLEGIDDYEPYDPYDAYEENDIDIGPRGDDDE